MKKKKQPSVTNDILDFCHQMRTSKKEKSNPRPASKYKMNCDIRKRGEAARENWIEHQCLTIDRAMSRNDSKKDLPLTGPSLWDLDSA